MNAKDLVSFKLTNNKIVIGLITSIDDKNIATIHTAVDRNTLQPIIFRWGGIQKHVNNLTKVTL